MSKVFELVKDFYVRYFFLVFLRGSELIWLFRIRIFIGNVVPDP
jgi:hypothetical protein